MEEGEPAEIIYDVIVLGAGLAGLGAARELIKGGLNVCLVEAQDQPGGRAKTVEMIPWRETEADSPSVAIVEAGAQWIHGKENALYKIAEENDLISPELGEEACGKFIRDDGIVFDEYLVRRVDFKIGQILEECESFVEQPLDKDISIRDYLERKINEFLLENPDMDPVEGRQLLEWHNRFQIIDNSCKDLKDVGVNEWGRYSFNGESCQAHINVKKGFSRVIQAIVREIGEKNILCNCEVTKVDLEDEIAKIILKNGKILRGRFVVMTFSIGVLKALEISFSPDLPSPMHNAITHIGFGTINKIYLKFQEAFWDPEFKGIQFLWSEGENFKSFPSWITHGMTGFDLLPENILIGWIGGSEGEKVETLTDQEIVSECRRVLGHFLGKTAPSPCHYYCTRWGSNKFTRGSYCFNGLVNKNAKPAPLTTLISNKLYLAGEACHPSYFSTAHGAFESGIEQAREILKRLNK